MQSMLFIEQRKASVIGFVVCGYLAYHSCMLYAVA